MGSMNRTKMPKFKKIDYSYVNVSNKTDEKTKREI